MMRRGLIFPLNLIVVLLGAAVISTIAVMAYITICHYALLYNLAYVKPAGVLWLLVGFGTGWFVSRLNFRTGLYDQRLVLAVAIATAWMLLVANWAGWTWFQFEGSWLRTGDVSVIGHLLDYALQTPQGWLDTMERFAQFSTIDYEDAIDEGFTAERMYWMEAAVLSLCAALMIIVTQRRI